MPSGLRSSAGEGSTRSSRARASPSASLNVDSRGVVDYSRVEGIDQDLRVKPFFAQGGTFNIRQFVIGAFNDEMGMPSPDPVLTAASEGRAW